mgnify:CR=1 FL=1
MRTAVLAFRQRHALLRVAHGTARLSGGELEGGKTGILPDAVGDLLVERVGIGKLSAEVIVPGIVAIGGSVIEAGENGELIAVIGNRFEKRRQLVVFPCLLREKGWLVKPQIGADADEALCLCFSREGSSAKGFQGRQCEGDASGF